MDNIKDTSAWNYVLVDKQDFCTTDLYKTLLDVIKSKGKDPLYKGELPVSFQLYPLYEEKITLESVGEMKMVVRKDNITKDFKWDIEE